MILTTLAPSLPPTKNPSKAEKKVLDKLRSKRDTWYIVEVSPTPITPLSFIADSVDIAFQVSRRPLRELPPAVVTAVSKASKKTSLDSEVYALWACATSHYKNRPSRKATSTPGSKYPQAIHRIAKRLWMEAKQYHPESLKEDQSKNPDWLTQISDIGDRWEEDKIHQVLDYIFGNEDRRIAPNAYWHDKVASPTTLSKHFASILDGMNNDARRRAATAAERKRKRDEPVKVILPTER